MKAPRALLACLLLACAAPEPGSALRPGPWHARLEMQQQELPFELVLERCGPGWRATVVNGEERLVVPRLDLEGDTLTLSFPHYDSAITAQIADGGARLDGTWRKRRNATEWLELPFHATAGAAPRFAAEGAPWKEGDPSVAGRWLVHFASEAQPAVAEIRVIEGDIVHGTFLTTTGDHRFLAGNAETLEVRDAGPDGQPVDLGVLSQRLRLSAFDGAHAFLYEATLRPHAAVAHGLLDGHFWSGDRFHDTWTGVRDEKAALPDGFTLTHARDGVRLDELSFPDLEGVPRRLADFPGKLRIVEIFGSWCPNCADEAEELVRLQWTYGARGLVVVGLAFELTGDLARDTEQVRRYAAHHGVTWPLLVAGVSDRKQATATLGVLDELRAYPTTIFLDAAGNVRAVYTGWNGPATRDAYEAQHAAFVRLIEELLAE